MATTYLSQAYQSVQTGLKALPPSNRELMATATFAKDGLSSRLSGLVSAVPAIAASVEGVVIHTASGLFRGVIQMGQGEFLEGWSTIAFGVLDSGLSLYNIFVVATTALIGLIAPTYAYNSVSHILDHVKKADQQAIDTAVANAKLPLENEKTALANKVGVLEKQIADNQMSPLLEDRVKALADANKMISEAEDKIATLVKELADVTGKLTNATNANDQTKQAMQTQMNTSADTEKGLRADLAKAQQELVDLKASEAALKTKVVQLENDIGILTAEKKSASDEAGKTIAGLNEQVATLTTSNEALQEELGVAQAQIAAQPAVDPDSDDAATIQSLQNEINVLKEDNKKLAAIADAAKKAALSSAEFAAASDKNSTPKKSKKGKGE